MRLGVVEKVHLYRANRWSKVISHFQSFFWFFVSWFFWLWQCSQTFVLRSSFLMIFEMSLWDFKQHTQCQMHVSFSMVESATTLAHAFSTPTKVTASNHTPFCCMCPNSSHVFCPGHISHLPRSWHSNDHISRWNVVEQCKSILKAPTFGIHLNQVVPQEDIRF